MNAIAMITAADAPTIPGTPFGGGFYTGRLQLDGKEFIVITAEKASEIKAPWGTYGQKIEGAHSFIDGLANTNAMAEAGSELAQQIRALRIGGHDDWALPARDQLELQYRYFKPTTQENYCSFRDGENLHAAPFTYPYTEESPTQTTAADFQEGGPEAFECAWYWASTQSSAHDAWIQDFGDGYQDNVDKVIVFRARAVRMIQVSN